MRLTVTYSRELAKSNPKYWAGRANLYTPDIDNVVKLVQDALNHVAWKDDKQITQITVKKERWTPNGTGNHIKIQVDYLREGRE